MLDETSSPSFECGGKNLVPQALPSFLLQYHERSLSFTEAALEDDTLHCERNVQYGPNPHQTLDVWSPSASVGGSSKALPIVVCIHGGGWEWGYKEWCGFVAQSVCAAPALLVTPSYKLGESREQAWPESRDDLLGALRWVRTHAQGLGGDASKLVLTGHSAGGHLAACLGLDPQLLRGAGVPPDTIKALFLLSCPLGLQAQHFAPRWLWRLWLTRPLLCLLHRGSIEKQLRAVVGYSASPEARDAAAAEASPLASAEAGTESRELPPLIHISWGGDGDFPICKPQARRLREALARTKDDDRPPRFVLRQLAEADHFETHYELADPGSDWHKELRAALSEL